MASRDQETVPDTAAPSPPTAQPKARRLRDGRGRRPDGWASTRSSACSAAEEWGAFGSRATLSSGATSPSSSGRSPRRRDGCALRIEARADHRCRMAHPNILRVHAASDLDDRPLLVTELLAGRSLDHLERPVPAERVSRAYRGRRRPHGLAAAARGRHPALETSKPANAFLCDDGIVIAPLDFGLARSSRALLPRTRTRGRAAESSGTGPPGAARRDDRPWPRRRPAEIVGTPESFFLYMAPETWQGEVATRRSDVYSLTGALLYELLSGEQPALRRALALQRPSPPSSAAGASSSSRLPPPRRRPSWIW